MITESRGNKTAHVIFSCLMLLFIYMFALVIEDTRAFYDRPYIYITAASFITLVIQVYQMKKAGLPIVGIVCIFIILVHIFHFGNYYIKALGKEEFFLFENWWEEGIFEKARMGLYALMAVQGLHIGILINKVRVKNMAGYKYEKEYTEDQKAAAIRFVGGALLLISAPFRLMWDYRAITANTGIYQGVATSGGLIDDLQVLFIPALICFMYGNMKNKKFNKVLFFVYIIGAVFVMTSSGARRQYITGIVAMFVFYYNTYMKGQKKKNIFTYILLGLSGVVLLNILYLIRSYRKTALGVGTIIFEHIDELFSLNFIWETIAEFGITGNALLYAMRHFPQRIPFQLGRTYLYSAIYIAPVGWIIKLKASVGGMLYSITGNAVGGSVLADLFANFGWYSVFFAIIVGFVIAKISETKGYGIKSATGYAVGSIILSYARGGLLETLRPVVIVIVVMYFGCKLYFEILERKGSNGKIAIR